MKIGLIGFGKTGRAVASAILQNEAFSLEWIFRRKALLEHRSAAEFLGINTQDKAEIFSGEHIDIHQLFNQQPVDILIDFSSQKGIYSYGKAAAAKNIPIISAISHYEEAEKELLHSLAKETTVFWSPNITLGVNYLMVAAKQLKKIAPWADIEIVEEHFKQKEGLSGTAMKIAESLDIDERNISSVRAGGIVGKHELIFGFPHQTVRLIHESISREAFGNGVLFVAQHLKDHPKGKLYNFEDILMPYFGN